MCDVISVFSDSDPVGAPYPRQAYPSKWPSGNTQVSSGYQYMADSSYDHGQVSSPNGGLCINRHQNGPSNGHPTPNIQVKWIVVVPTAKKTDQVEALKSTDTNKPQAMRHLTWTDTNMPQTMVGVPTVKKTAQVEAHWSTDTNKPQTMGHHTPNILAKWTVGDPTLASQLIIHIYYYLL